MKNKAKLKLIFAPQEIKVLEDIQEHLKRRNYANTAGSAMKSNTQSDTTLLNSLFDLGGNVLDKGVKSIPFIGGAYGGARDHFKNARNNAIKSLQERALIDPLLARDILLTPRRSTAISETINPLRYAITPE